MSLPYRAISGYRVQNEFLIQAVQAVEDKVGQSSLSCPRRVQFTENELIRVRWITTTELTIPLPKLGAVRSMFKAFHQESYLKNNLSETQLVSVSTWANTVKPYEFTARIRVYRDKAVVSFAV